MRAILGISVAVGVLAVTSTHATAQGLGDQAAWLAMTFTPYGSLPPLVTPGMVGSPRADDLLGVTFEVKYGHWAFGVDDDEWNNFGFGGRLGNAGFVVGYGKCQQCGNDGVIMGAVDFESTLARWPFGIETSLASFAVGVRPSLGLGVATGGGEMNALAANVDVPISFTMPIGTGAHLVPFVASGFGIGRFSVEGESETGARPAIAAGVGFLAARGFGIHLAWRKILIADGPSTLGVGASFGR